MTAFDYENNAAPDYVYEEGAVYLFEEEENELDSLPSEEN